MLRPLLTWSVAIGGLIVYDVRCHRNETLGDTLSEVLRTTLHTEHPVGRVAFLTGWAVLSAWFVPHILDYVPPMPQESAHG